MDDVSLVLIFSFLNIFYGNLLRPTQWMGSMFGLLLNTGTSGFMVVRKRNPFKMTKHLPILKSHGKWCLSWRYTIFGEGEFWNAFPLDFVSIGPIACLTSIAIRFMVCGIIQFTLEFRVAQETHSGLGAHVLHGGVQCHFSCQLCRQGAASRFNPEGWSKYKLHTTALS